MKKVQSCPSSSSAGLFFAKARWRSGRRAGTRRPVSLKGGPCAAAAVVRMASPIEALAPGPSNPAARAVDDAARPATHVDRRLTKRKACTPMEPA
jgi:hypothetical protein